MEWRERKKCAKKIKILCWFILCTVSLLLLWIDIIECEKKTGGIKCYNAISKRITIKEKTKYFACVFFFGDFQVEANDFLGKEKQKFKTISKYAFFHFTKTAVNFFSIWFSITRKWLCYGNSVQNVLVLYSMSHFHVFI